MPAITLEQANIVATYIWSLPTVLSLDLLLLKDACDICTDPFSAIPGATHDAVRTECNHVFGRSCLEDWLSIGPQNNSCPLCRKKLISGYEVAEGYLPWLDFLEDGSENPDDYSDEADSYLDGIEYELQQLGVPNDGTPEPGSSDEDLIDLQNSDDGVVELEGSEENLIDLEFPDYDTVEIEGSDDDTIELGSFDDDTDEAGDHDLRIQDEGDYDQWWIDIGELDSNEQEWRDLVDIRFYIALRASRTNLLGPVTDEWWASIWDWATHLSAEAMQLGFGRTMEWEEAVFNIDDEWRYTLRGLSNPLSSTVHDLGKAWNKLQHLEIMRIAITSLIDPADDNGFFKVAAAWDSLDFGGIGGRHGQIMVRMAAQVRDEVRIFLDPPTVEERAAVENAAAVRAANALNAPVQAQQ